MHRERGLHLDDPDLLVDGKPASATILGTLLTLYHAGQEQTKRDQGIYFYLPKTESPEEAALYRDLFASIQNRVLRTEKRHYSRHPASRITPIGLDYGRESSRTRTIRCRLNAARWDLKASLLEYVMADRASLWPDRFGVAVPTTPFIANIFRRLVAVCMKHNAVPIGGMATALPHRDQAVNEEAGCNGTRRQDMGG